MMVRAVPIVEGVIVQPLRGTTVVSLEMKTLPALAGVPVSRQAVVTVGPSTLSVECKVNTATGSADYSSLIAIPTG